MPQRCKSIKKGKKYSKSKKMRGKKEGKQKEIKMIDTLKVEITKTFQII